MPIAHKNNTKDQPISEEVGGLINKIQIDVGSDRSIVIKPSNRLAGTNAEVAIENFFHEHDPSVDIFLRATTPAGEFIKMQEYDLVLKNRETEKPVGQTGIDDGTTSFRNVPSGRYRLELVQRQKNMPWPNLDVQTKPLP